MDIWDFRSKKKRILKNYYLNTEFGKFNCKVAHMNMYQKYAITQCNSSFNKYNPSNS